MDGRGMRSEDMIGDMVFDGILEGDYLCSLLLATATMREGGSAVWLGNL